MFFRATERSEGSGLGLYIVKSMVEKLKGRISFESTHGRGTTFLVTIPNEAQSSLKHEGFTNYFMLTPEQIKLVENSWDYILLNSNEAGTIFYKKLFSMAPELRQLFKGDINSQSQKLVSLITFAVHKLNSFNDIVSDVRTLGMRHKGYKVKPEHYSVVNEALLWTLSKGLGDRWNDETKQAWAATYQALSKIMIEASQHE
jgi:nitric oxide dioxygenase